jgi:hypothetical protein
MTLVAIGAITTIPAAMSVFRHRVPDRRPSGAFPASANPR